MSLVYLLYVTICTWVIVRGGDCPGDACPVVMWLSGGYCPGRDCPIQRCSRAWTASTHFFI